jgi:hypothetical protein
MKLIRNEQEWIAFRDYVMMDHNSRDYIIEYNTVFIDNIFIDYPRSKDMPSYPVLVDYLGHGADFITFTAVTVEDAEELLSAAQAMFRPMESGTIDKVRADVYNGILAQL